MEVVLSFVIGGLYAAAVYLMMRRSIVKLILGLALLGHAANLLIFTIGRLVRGCAGNLRTYVDSNLPHLKGCGSFEAFHSTPAVKCDRPNLPHLKRCGFIELSEKICPSK